MMYKVLQLFTPLTAFIILSIGLIFLVIGLTTSVYRPLKFSTTSETSKRDIYAFIMLAGILNRITQVFPLNSIKSRIIESFSFLLLDDATTKLLGSIFALTTSVAGLITLAFLINLGQIWYSRILIVIMSFILPYYILTLFMDLYRQRVTRQIPKFIDEFRSAFIKTGKVRPALIECSEFVGGGMGRLVLKASGSVFVEDSLCKMKEKFNSIWFNIFVTLIINFKENGGDIIGQLYQLNRTMTRHNNIEKKKNRRLIWYEVFAVVASVFSIPAIFWISNVILDNEIANLADAGANMMISQVILFSLLSLVVIRILRKM